LLDEVCEAVMGPMCAAPPAPVPVRPDRADDHSDADAQMKKGPGRLRRVEGSGKRTCTLQPARAW
jgi:hypothetical protein